MLPNLLFARPNGEFLDFPVMKAAGRSGARFVEPWEEEWMPLPEGSALTAVPFRFPVGFMCSSGELSSLKHNPFQKHSEEVWAVAALLPQGFTRTLLPAFISDGSGRSIPLLGYAAVGVKKGQLVVAACQTDEHHLWNPEHYNTEELELLVEQKTKHFSHNRLIRQLGTCSLEYGCFTAQNIFYGRWEGGIPVSPVCNAKCLGCISSQPSECCPAPQRRLEFVPTFEEVKELALSHLQNGSEAIVSFGQGCEGEPSLQADLIASCLKEVRKETKQGTFNINTNAGHTESIKKIIDAGLDAMRVSLISPTPEIYMAYHRPQGYTLSDVYQSLSYAAEAGIHTSLNLLTFPGVTDDQGEIEALIELIKNTGVKKVQFRNLNIDPDEFMKLVPETTESPVGIVQMIRILREELPELEIGNYTRAVR